MASEAVAAPSLIGGFRAACSVGVFATGNASAAAPGADGWTTGLDGATGGEGSTRAAAGALAAAGPGLAGPAAAAEPTGFIPQPCPNKPPPLFSWRFSLPPASGGAAAVGLGLLAAPPSTGLGAAFLFAFAMAATPSAASTESTTSKSFSFKNPLILRDSSAFSLGAAISSGNPWR